MLCRFGIVHFGKRSSFRHCRVPELLVETCASGILPCHVVALSHCSHGEFWLASVPPIRSHHRTKRTPRGPMMQNALLTAFHDISTKNASSQTPRAPLRVELGLLGAVLRTSRHTVSNTTLHAQYPLASSRIFPSALGAKQKQYPVPVCIGLTKSKAPLTK